MLLTQKLYLVYTIILVIFLTLPTSHCIMIILITILTCFTKYRAISYLMSNSTFRTYSSWSWWLLWLDFVVFLVLFLIASIYTGDFDLDDGLKVFCSRQLTIAVFNVKFGFRSKRWWMVSLLYYNSVFPDHQNYGSLLFLRSLENYWKIHWVVVLPWKFVTFINNVCAWFYVFMKFNISHM